MVQHLGRQPAAMRAFLLDALPGRDGQAPPGSGLRLGPGGRRAARSLRGERPPGPVLMLSHTGPDEATASAPGALVDTCLHVVPRHGARSPKAAGAAVNAWSSGRSSSAHGRREGLGTRGHAESRRSRVLRAGRRGHRPCQRPRLLPPGRTGRSPGESCRGERGSRRRTSVGQSLRAARRRRTHAHPDRRRPRPGGTAGGPGSARRAPCRTARRCLTRPAWRAGSHRARTGVRPGDHRPRDERRRQLAPPGFARVYMTERCCLWRWIRPLATRDSRVFRTTWGVGLRSGCFSMSSSRSSFARRGSS